MSEEDKEEKPKERKIESQKIEGYDLPTPEEIFVDVGEQKIIDKENLSPWEIIRLTAEQKNIKLKEFKPLKVKKWYPDEVHDTGCRRSGCYGRGYIGFQDGIPVPCVCIFDKKDREKYFLPNRAANRNMEKMVRAEIKGLKDKIAKKEGMKCIDRDTYRNKNGNLFFWDSTRNKFRSINEKNQVKKDTEYTVVEQENQTNEQQ